MNRTYLLAVPLLSVVGLAQAQLQSGEASFQPAASLSALRTVLPMPPAETGKPFSALAISQSEQTWLDGTHVTHVVTMMEYRDMEGRTRMEPAEPPAAAKLINIRDPVAGVKYSLDVAGKTARKTAIGVAGAPTGSGRGGRGGANFTITNSGGTVTTSSDLLAQVQDSRQKLAQTSRKNPNDIVADLGTMSINGVTAHGTRITTVVPVGAIGNDREFRSIEERWFSDGLNLLIRSVSTDPRFGTTTYERKNISRRTPDPSLFQVPAGYSVVSN